MTLTQVTAIDLTFKSHVFNIWGLPNPAVFSQFAFQN